MAKIMITGAAGFIGSQLGYRLYKDGHEMLLIDDMSFGYEDNLENDGERFGTFVREDVRSEKMYAHMKGVDYVFHFAGISALPVCQEQPYRAIDVNVAGTANVLAAARKNNVKRVIFASTSRDRGPANTSAPRSSVTFMISTRSSAVRPWVRWSRSRNSAAAAEST